MNKEQKALKQKILDSIKYVREELKFTLISEDWGDVKHKCACALGCVLLKEDSDGLVLSPAENGIKAAELLSVSEEWIDSFIEGFDGNGTSDQSKVPAAWDMGWDIAKETKPIENHKWDGEYHG